jgi:hypothetical protein
MVPGDVSSCVCTTTKAVALSSPWPALDETNTAIIVTSACVGCGTVFAPVSGRRLSADYRARFAARDQIGRHGTWSTLGLPSIRRLGEGIGDADLVFAPPKQLRFFAYDFDNMALSDLQGTVRGRLGLGRSLWPRAIVTPAWDRPVIVHHGLVEKFATKRDNQHLHLVSLTHRTIEIPLEGWIDDYGGSRNLHLLAKYRLGHDAVVVHMVCVDTATALCTTSYQLSSGTENDKRKGDFQYARWAVPG